MLYRNAGRIQTDHHEVVLKVKTMLDYTQHDGGRSEADDVTVNGSETLGELENCLSKPCSRRKNGSGVSGPIESCGSSIKSAPYSESEENTNHPDLYEVSVSLTRCTLS